MSSTPFTFTFSSGGGYIEYGGIGAFSGGDFLADVGDEEDGGYEATLPDYPGTIYMASTGYIAESFSVGSDIVYSNDTTLENIADSAYISSGFDPDSEVLNHYGISRQTPYIIGSFDYLPYYTDDGLDAGTYTADDDLGLFMTAALASGIYTNYQAAGVLEYWGDDMILNGGSSISVFSRDNYIDVYKGTRFRGKEDLYRHHHRCRGLARCCKFNASILPVN